MPTCGDISPEGQYLLLKVRFVKLQKTSPVRLLERQNFMSWAGLTESEATFAKYNPK